MNTINGMRTAAANSKIMTMDNKICQRQFSTLEKKFIGMNIDKRKNLDLTKDHYRLMEFSPDPFEYFPLGPRMDHCSVSDDREDLGNRSQRQVDPNSIKKYYEMFF